MLLIALAAVAILCCAAALRAQRVLWIAVATEWCLLGAWCALMEPQPTPASQIAALSDGLMRTVEGTVIDAGPIRIESEQSVNEDGNYGAASLSELTQRLDMQVGSLEEVTDTSDRQIPAAGNVRLTVRWPAGTSTEQAATTFRCGDSIRADARLLRPAVFHDPGVWNRADYLLDQGITSTASVNIHPDHMGGLQTVLRNFNPDELWVGNNPSSQAYDALIDQAKSQHVHLRNLRAEDAFHFGTAQVNVLAPARDYQPALEAANNDSLVLHMAYGGTAVLLEGDAESPVERQMLGERILESTLLKVGHHGSASSTTPEFLSRVAPRFAVISCGARNRYGHPRQQILEELQAAQVRTFRTDTEGVACFVLDGSSVKEQTDCRQQ
jgi:hypothetical protein